MGQKIIEWDDDLDDDEFREVGRDEQPFWLIPKRNTSEIKTWDDKKYSTHEKYLRAKTSMDSSTEAMSKGWVRGQISKYSGKIVYFTFARRPSEQELRDLAFDVASKLKKPVERVVYDAGGTSKEMALRESDIARIRTAILVESLLREQSPRTQR